MRTLISLLFLALFTTALSAQSITNTCSHASIMFRTHLDNNPTLAFNSGIDLPALQRYSFKDWQDKISEGGNDGNRTYYTRKSAYKSAKAKRNGGIAMTCIGAAILGCGAALIADGVPKLTNANNPNVDTVLGIYETYFGVGTAVAGAAITIVGPVLWSRGAKKLRKLKAPTITE